MVTYKTLSLKPTVVINGEELIDLFSQTYNSLFPKIRDVVVVEKDYVARPDLISLAMYGEDQHADLICKVNNIQNPFEMYEGQILLIPMMADENRMYNNSPEESELVSSNISISKQTSKYAKKLNEERAPNELTEGQYNYLIDKETNLIFY